MSSFDLIVIGGGHNGLVTAAYVAGTGADVLVLERREVLGGACVTEELWPGFKVSTAAYVNSLLRPEIIRDLELKRHGFKMLPRNPSSFTPFPDGRSLLLGPNKAQTHSEVSKFSTKDADALPKYEAMLERVAAFIEPTLTQTPPEPMVLPARQSGQAGQAGDELRSPGHGWPEGDRDPDRSGHPNSRSVVRVRAVEGHLGHRRHHRSDGFPFDAGNRVRPVPSRYGRMRRHQGSLGLRAGRHGRHQQRHCLSCPGAGRANQDQRRSQPHSGETGRGSRSSSQGWDRVSGSARCLGCRRSRHLPQIARPEELPDDFVQDVRNIDYSSASLKINISLSELPDFKAVPGTEPGPQHRGTIHISPTMQYIERAYDNAKYGCPSDHPIIEATIPSVLDDTLAPPGKHVMSMFTQYFPYKLAPGLTLQEEKEKYAERCFDLMNEYAPNFRRSVLGRQVLTPVDLERRFGLTGGNIMQGTMSSEQSLFHATGAGYADYRTPIRGLYLCGAATHPGGGVMGACGYNAAREIMRDMRARPVRRPNGPG